VRGLQYLSAASRYATNELDEGQLSAQAVLDGYKGQAQAERGFRFLKDPQFLASSLYLGFYQFE